MNIFRLFPIFLVGSAFIACSGSKPAPAVQSKPVPPKAPVASTSTPTGTTTVPLKTQKVIPSPVVAPNSITVPAPELTPPPEPLPVDEQQVFFDNAVDRYSYALGVDFGRAIANINVPVKLEVLISAMEDVVDSTREVLMSDSSSEAALQDLLMQMQMQKGVDEAAASRKALAEQAEFLAKNIQVPNVKVTKKGVQYVVLKEGTGITPRSSDKVQVHYVGSLMDGSEFDNSVRRGSPLEFPVTAVIEGWQDLLLEMKVGEKVKAWIPSVLAYGETGVPPTIPPNALLVFEVELLQVFAEVPSGKSMVPAKGSVAEPASN